MEIKFNETACHCLRRVADQLQVREQTQEVRLPEAMPDIGRVLGCWGQCVVRGKQWSGDSMSVSGGVLARVLYVPEDGSEARSVEAWIPFQLRWDFPQTQHDGAIWVSPCLKSLDARSTSARKLMIRANISAWGKAFEGVDVPVFVPGQLPEDVQLLKVSYPMELPVEAGEKTVKMEEELQLSGSEPAVEQILYYGLTMDVQEQKVMATRLVFRGRALLHLLYRSGERLCSWDCEIPFSQFADLDRDLGPHGAAQITPVLTNLELEQAEGKLLLKAEAAAQYVLFDRVMVETVEDAYSPLRKVEPEQEQLRLPRKLDEATTQLRAQQKIQAEAGNVVDVCWMPDHPQRQQDGDVAEVTAPGQYQVLYYDMNGALQCAAGRCEPKVQLGADSATVLEGACCLEGRPQAVSNGQELELSFPLRLQTHVMGDEGQSVVRGLQMGEASQPDPNRPSLILRRCDDSGLWNIAKSCGSTVEAIQRANALQGEPEYGRMLLIPVC